MKHFFYMTWVVGLGWNLPRQHTPGVISVGTYVRDHETWGMQGCDDGWVSRAGDGIAL